MGGYRALAIGTGGWFYTGNLFDRGNEPLAPYGLYPLRFEKSVFGRFLGPFHPGVSGKGQSPLGWSALWQIPQWNGGVLTFAVPWKLAVYSLVDRKCLRRIQTSSMVMPLLSV